MDKEKVKKLAAKAVLALKALEKEFGVTVKYHGGNYDDVVGSAILKFTFEEPGKDKALFERNAVFFGLKPEDFGSRFMALGEEYEVVGIRPGASKHPVLARRVSDGQQFKFNPRAVRPAAVGILR